MHSRHDVWHHLREALRRDLTVRGHTADIITLAARSIERAACGLRVFEQGEQDTGRLFGGIFAGVWVYV